MKYIYNKCMVVSLFVAAAVSACAPDDIDQSSSSSSNTGSLLDLWLAAREEQEEEASVPRVIVLSSSSARLASLVQAPEEGGSLPCAQRSKRAHEDSPYRCDTCDVNNTFKSKKGLSHHIKSSKKHRRLLGEGLTKEEQNSRMQKQPEELPVERVRGQFSCDVCVCSFSYKSCLKIHMNTDTHAVQVAKVLYTAEKYNEALVYGEEILLGDQLSHNARLQIKRLVERCKSIVAPQSVASSSSSSSSSLPVMEGLHCEVCDKWLSNAHMFSRHKNSNEHEDNLAFLALLAQPVTISEPKVNV
jgi:hypothetical protein